MTHRRTVLQAIATSPGATTQDLVTATGLPFSVVSTSIKNSRAHGDVDSDNHGRVWRHWLARAIRPSPIPSVDRVLAAITGGATQLAEIQTRLNMPHATVQRALMTLQTRGAIVVDSSRRAHRFLIAPPLAQQVGAMRAADAAPDTPARDWSPSVRVFGSAS